MIIGDIFFDDQRIKPPFILLVKTDRLITKKYLFVSLMSTDWSINKTETAFQRKKNEKPI